MNSISFINLQLPGFTRNQSISFNNMIDFFVAKKNESHRFMVKTFDQQTVGLKIKSAHPHNGGFSFSAVIEITPESELAFLQVNGFVRQLQLSAPVSSPEP